MNKTQIKQLLAPQITSIQSASRAISAGKWEKAKAFTEISEMIVWRKSPYKSFTNFCAEVFPSYHFPSITVSMYAYRKITKWYTWAEIQTISKSVAYSLVISAFPRIQRKRTVKQFIAFAKKPPPPAANTRYSTTVRGTNRIAMDLTPKYMELFEQMLIPHGYKLPDAMGIRHGVSKAMCKYLDTI